LRSQEDNINLENIMILKSQMPNIRLSKSFIIDTQKKYNRWEEDTHQEEGTVRPSGFIRLQVLTFLTLLVMGSKPCFLLANDKP